MKKQTILGLIAATVSMSTPAVADSEYGWSLNSVAVTGRLVESNTPIVYTTQSSDFTFSKITTADILKGALDSENISGYALVEVRSTYSSYGFFAYNKKTGAAVSIPNYWLYYSIDGESYSVSRYKTTTKGDSYKTTFDAFINTYSVELYGGSGFSPAKATGSYDSSGKFKLSYVGKLYINAYSYDTASSYQGLIDGTIKSSFSKNYASYSDIPESIRAILEIAD